MLPFPNTVWTDLQFVDSRINCQLKLRSGSVLDLVSLQLENVDYYMRPALLLAIARAYGYKEEKAIAVAGVVQFIYLATGVHATVEDDREEGQCADFQFPVLVGDYLYGQFFLQLCKASALEYLAPLSRVICEIHEGGVLKQQQGLDSPVKIGIVTKEEGSLPAAACRIGAHLGGASPGAQELFAEVGSSLGLALGLAKHGFDKGQVEDTFQKVRNLLKELPVPVPDLVHLTDYLAQQMYEQRSEI